MSGPNRIEALYRLSRGPVVLKLRGELLTRSGLKNSEPSIPASADAGGWRREVKQRYRTAGIKWQIGAIIQAVKDGLYHPSLKTELRALDARKSERIGTGAGAPVAAAAVIHPNLPELSRRKVETLHEALARPEIRAEVAKALRALIEQIRLVPENGKLAIDLHGTLAGILSATNTNAARMVPGGGSRVLVAGARNHLYRTTGLLPSSRVTTKHKPAKT